MTDTTERHKAHRRGSPPNFGDSQRDKNEKSYRACDLETETTDSKWLIANSSSDYIQQLQNIAITFIGKKDLEIHSLTTCTHTHRERERQINMVSPH